MHEPAEGWKRFVVKTKIAIGRDFEVKTAAGQRAYAVDGKIGVRPHAEVQDGAGNVIYGVRGKLLGVPKRMSISDATGREVASLKAKMLSPIKEKMTLEMTDGQDWHVEGEILEKEYTITSGDRRVATVTEKWVTVRDTYTLDVRDDIDPGLVLAVLWAIDRWVERN